jgi:hypothetical protein
MRSQRVITRAALAGAKGMATSPISRALSEVHWQSTPNAKSQSAFFRIDPEENR